MHIFSRLDEGAAIAAVIQRARAAYAAAPHNAEAARALASDAYAQQILPLFGWQVRPENFGRSEAHPRGLILRCWCHDYSASYFLIELRAQLFQALTTERQEDGTLVQRLSATSAAALWQQAQRDQRGAGDGPSDSTAQSYHIAELLHSFGGLPWVSTGDAVSRSLPPWPLRIVPWNGNTPPYGTARDKLAFACVGWAVIPAKTPANPDKVDQLVYLSGVGQQKRLRATWATVQDQSRTPITLPVPKANMRWQRGGDYTGRQARRPEGKGVYQTFFNDAPLPQSDMAHMVMIHWSILNPRAGEPFIHLTGEDGLPDLDYFMHQLELACALPLKAAWVADLWQQGVERELIIALPAYGCVAYLVRIDDEVGWGHVVARCLGAPQASFTTYGGGEDVVNSSA